MSSSPRHSIMDLPREVQQDIGSYLDNGDRDSLQAALGSFASNILSINNPTTTPPASAPAQTTTPSVHFSNPFSTPTIASSTLRPSMSRINSTASTYTTEVTTPWDEEGPFNFVVTEDLTRRLSLLPTHSTQANLPRLPVELQLQIFSYLDKIDSTCLGLAHPTTYMMFRSIYGLKMPLNQRRSGPNNLEKAWEGQGNLDRTWEVVGKKGCQYCGDFRCELYMHLQEWMQGSGPEKLNLEYCSMAKKFGKAGEGHSDKGCFKVKPSKPRRCGKHPVRTTTIHQDDNSAAAGAILAFASANAEATLPGALDANSCNKEQPLPTTEWNGAVLNTIAS